VITQFINVFIGVLSWGVRAAYVQRPVYEMYGSDYISFLVVGIAIGNLVMPLVQGVQRQLNPWTLETILMTGIGTPVFVIGNVMWRYVFSVITFIPYLVIGVYMFNVKLNVDVPSTIVAFAISAAILMGLAMISTGLFPVIYLDTIFFPGISTVSWLLPQTWVYHLCRLAMLTNASLLDPAMQVQFLQGSVFALILFPIGYKIFHWGVARSKREGTLGWY
jgi:hypothetical protein